MKTSKKDKLNNCKATKEKSVNITKLSKKLELDGKNNNINEQEMKSLFTCNMSEETKSTINLAFNNKNVKISKATERNGTTHYDEISTIRTSLGTKISTLSLPYSNMVRNMDAIKKSSLRESQSEIYRDE